MNVRSPDSLRATDDRALPALFSSTMCARTEFMSRSAGPSSDIFLPRLRRDEREVLRDVAVVGADGVRRDVPIQFQIREEGLQMVAHVLPRGQARDPVRQRGRHLLRLLGKERVTRVLDHDDRDAIAELVLHLLARAPGPERVLVGLQIQERRNPARPPLLLRDGRGRGALRLAKVWMPPGRARDADRCPEQRRPCAAPQAAPLPEAPDLPLCRSRLAGSRRTAWRRRRRWRRRERAPDDRPPSCARPSFRRHVQPRRRGRRRAD